MRGDKGDAFDSEPSRNWTCSWIVSEMHHPDGNII